MEKTLVLIKPDAVERKLIGEILRIYENKGLNIIALKLISPSIKIAEEHYSEHRDKPFFSELIKFITRNQVCAMVIEGRNAIETVRKINGSTDPLQAEAGSVRGQFAVSKSENSVHSSDSIESAEREINIWFPELRN